MLNNRHDSSRFCVSALKIYLQGLVGKLALRMSMTILPFFRS